MLVLVTEITRIGEEGAQQGVNDLVLVQSELTKLAKSDTSNSDKSTRCRLFLKREISKPGIHERVEKQDGTYVHRSTFEGGNRVGELGCVPARACALVPNRRKYNSIAIKTLRRGFPVGFTQHGGFPVGFTQHAKGDRSFYWGTIPTGCGSN